MPEVVKQKKKQNRAKNYLMQIRFIDYEIKWQEEEIERLTQLVQGVQAIDYEASKVQTSSNEGEAGYIIKILEYREKILSSRIKTLDLIEKIRGQIAGMPDPMHRQILFRYYVDMQRFEKIASDLNYSYQYIINAHGRALKALKNNIFERKKAR